MNKLTYVNIDELKVGDVVGYCKYPGYGWNLLFRYPIVSRKVIERITPKRTKFVLDGNIELDIQSAKKLVVYDETAKAQSAIAKKFQSLSNIQYKFEEAKRKGNHVIESKLTDDELTDYYNVLKNIYDKYLSSESTNS